MPDVGADIESICAKCGDVWHVVVAVVGTKVAKVQCKQCGAYHRHKSGAAAKASAVKRPRKSTLRPGETSARAPAKPVIDPDKPIKPYKMSDAFQTGDQIQHLRFGVGVVESAAEPGKIAVLFDDGRKFLAVAKADTGLATANDMVRAARRAAGDAVE